MQATEDSCLKEYNIKTNNNNNKNKKYHIKLLLAHAKIVFQYYWRLVWIFRSFLFLLCDKQ